MGFLLEWEVKEKPRTTSTAKSWRGLQASYIQHTSSSGSTEYPSCDFSTCRNRFASKIDVLQTKYGWYKKHFLFVCTHCINRTAHVPKILCGYIWYNWYINVFDVSSGLPSCVGRQYVSVSLNMEEFETTLAASWGSQGRRCLSNIQIRTKSAVRSGIQSGYPKW